MAKRDREISGERINFSGIYHGARPRTGSTSFIELSKDPYFVAIGGEETGSHSVVNPLLILDFCAVMALIFLVMFWESN